MPWPKCNGKGEAVWREKVLNFALKFIAPAPRDSGDSTLGADSRAGMESRAAQLSGKQNMCPPGGRGIFLTIKVYFKRLNGD